MNPVRGLQIIINKNRLPPVASPKAVPAAIILNTRRFGARVFSLKSHGDFVTDFATRACSVHLAFGLQGSMAATLHNLYRTIPTRIDRSGSAGALPRNARALVPSQLSPAQDRSRRH